MHKKRKKNFFDNFLLLHFYLYGKHLQSAFFFDKFFIFFILTSFKKVSFIFFEIGIFYLKLWHSWSSFFMFFLLIYKLCELTIIFWFLYLIIIVINRREITWCKIWKIFLLLTIFHYNIIFLNFSFANLFLLNLIFLITLLL